MSNKIQIPAEQLKIVLFKNKNKKTEAHPDYNGNVEINFGNEVNKDVKKYRVVMWKNVGKKSNETYLSGKIDYTKEIEETKPVVPTSAVGDDF